MCRAAAAAVLVALVLPAATAACGGGGGHGDGGTSRQEDQQEGPGEGAPGPTAPDLRGDVEAWFASLESRGFRGAVGLVEEGERTLTAGFGPRDPVEGDARIDAGTRFAVGSITKTFVDIVLLTLVDSGELALSDRLGDLLPGVPADKAGITVEQLMGHTAGFEHVHGSDRETIGRAEALERIYAQDLRFPPGTGHHYSNSGYTVLAVIVEEVTGRGIETLLHDEIFGPAGMHSTGFRGDGAPAAANSAAGHDDAGDPVPLRGRPPIGWTLQGNGGVESTVEDLLAFDEALCAGRVAPDAVVGRLGICGTSGGWGSAGGGSELSHTAIWERDLDTGTTLVVLSAEWGFSAEELALPLLDALTTGDDLPRSPETGGAATDAAVADLP